MEETIGDLISTKWCTIDCINNNMDMGHVGTDDQYLLHKFQEGIPGNDNAQQEKDYAILYKRKRSVISLRSPTNRNNERERRRNTSCSYPQVIIRGESAVSVISAICANASEIIAIVFSAAIWLCLFLPKSLENEYDSVLFAVNDSNLPLEYVVAVQEFHQIATRIE